MGEIGSVRITVDNVGAAFPSPLNSDEIQAGATTGIGISFTTETTIPVNGIIVIDFPPGFDASGTTEMRTHTMGGHFFAPVIAGSIGSGFSITAQRDPDGFSGFVHAAGSAEHTVTLDNIVFPTSVDFFTILVETQDSFGNPLDTSDVTGTIAIEDNMSTGSFEKMAFSPSFVVAGSEKVTMSVTFPSTSESPSPNIGVDLPVDAAFEFDLGIEINSVGMGTALSATVDGTFTESIAGTSNNVVRVERNGDGSIIPSSTTSFSLGVDATYTWPFRGVYKVKFRILDGSGAILNEAEDIITPSDGSASGFNVSASDTTRGATGVTYTVDFDIGAFGAVEQDLPRNAVIALVPDFGGYGFGESTATSSATSPGFIDGELIIDPSGLETTGSGFPFLRILRRGGSDLGPGSYTLDINNVTNPPSPGTKFWTLAIQEDANIPDIPIPPTNLVVVGIDVYERIVTWDPSDEFARIYRVERTIAAPIDWVSLGTIKSHEALIFSDITASPSTTYNYRIIALNRLREESGPSNVYSHTTPVFSPTIGLLEDFEYVSEAAFDAVYTDKDGNTPPSASFKIQDLFTATAPMPKDGTQSLVKRSFAGFVFVFRNDAAVLNGRGERMSVWVDPSLNTSPGTFRMGFIIGSELASGNDSGAGYYFEIQTGSTTQQIRIRHMKYRDPIGLTITTLAFKEVPVTTRDFGAATLMRLETYWDWDGTLTFNLFDADGTTLLETLSVVDSLISRPGGIGFVHNGSSSRVPRWDRVERV